MPAPGAPRSRPGPLAWGRRSAGGPGERLERATPSRRTWCSRSARGRHRLRVAAARRPRPARVVLDRPLRRRPSSALVPQRRCTTRRAVTVRRRVLHPAPVWSDVDLRTGEPHRACTGRRRPGHDPSSVRRASGVPFPVAGRHAGAGDAWSGAGTRPSTAPRPRSSTAYGAYEAVDEPRVGPRPAEPARPRRRLRARPRPRRRRGRPAVVARRPASRTSSTPSTTTSRWPTGSRATGLVDGRPDRHPRAERRRAAAGRGASASARTGGGPSWPRCRSSTWSPRCSTRSIPLTITEWDEWGDPRRREDFDWMLAYSPYDNLPPAGGTARPAGHRRGARPAGDGPRAREVGRPRCATPTRSGRRAACSACETGAGAHAARRGGSARLGYEAEVFAWVLGALGVPTDAPVSKDYGV